MEIGVHSIWKSQSYRQNIVLRLEEAVQRCERCGMSTTRNGIQIENDAFQRATTKEEYLSFVATQMLQMGDLASKIETENRNSARDNASGSTNSINQRMLNLIRAFWLIYQVTGNNEMLSINGLGPNFQGMNEE